VVRIAGDGVSPGAATATIDIARTTGEMAQATNLRIYILQADGWKEGDFAGPAGTVMRITKAVRPPDSRTAEMKWNAALRQRPENGDGGN
jgi:hypothetical protein